MANEIMSHWAMCRREGMNLQRGMNFGVGGTHSVILMSLRRGAPYADKLLDDGTTLIYEGHDAPRSASRPDPKGVDQPDRTPKGTLTQNGKFLQAAVAARDGIRPPERVRVYEKIREGIWSYNGVFHLVDATQEHINGRWVFKFRLEAVQGDDDLTQAVRQDVPRRRVIPTPVKVEVWARDGARCVKCGATDELHFDHVLPYARGGSSIISANVQLLCARHNLEKSDRIQ